jgi:hypothetical protein
MAAASAAVPDEFREGIATRAPSDGPTIDDLTYDDSLSDLERIARYGCSAVALQRLVHVKLMVETAKSVGCARERARCVPRQRRPSHGPRPSPPLNASAASLARTPSSTPS